MPELIGRVDMMERGMVPEELEYVISSAKNCNTLFFSFPCSNACCFCAKIQNGPKLPPLPSFTSFPSTEDLKRVVGCLDFSKDVQIDMCDNFNLPFIYELLEIIYDKQKECPKKGRINLVSTFSRFDISKVWLLKRIENLYVDMTLITFDTSLKSSLMRGGWTDENTDTIKELIRQGVPNYINTWYFGDPIHLREDLDILAELLGPEKLKRIELGLNYPHSTNYSNEQTIRLAERARASIDEGIKTYLNFVREHNVERYAYPSMDQEFLLEKVGADAVFENVTRKFRQRVEAAIEFIKIKTSHRLEDVGFIASDTFYNYAKREFPHLNWVHARHGYWGGTVSAATLLLLEDIGDAIRDSRKYEAYVASKDMLVEGEGKRDMSGRGIEEFCKEIGAEIFFF